MSFHHCLVFDSTMAERMTKWTLLLLTAVQGPVAAQERVWRQHDFAEDGGVRPDGDPLLAPFKVMADDSTLYLFDNGDFRLKAFDWAGRLRWAIGRSGSGPGEFRGVIATCISPQGEIWLYDKGNARISIVTPKGDIRREFRPQKLLISGVVPVKGGGFLAQVNSGSQFFLTLFDSIGVVVRALPVPKDLVGRNVLEAHVVGDRSGGRAVFSALETDRFYVVSDSGDQVQAYRGVQAMDFPKWTRTTITTGRGKKIEGIRPAPGNLSGSIATILSDDLILVLVGTIARDEFRTVDTYEMPSGRYRESFLLPAPCVSLAHVRGRFVCLQLDPVPQVRIWRQRP